MLDGDKRANVQANFGVRRGCPLSPLLFSPDWHRQPGWGGAGRDTGIPNFTVTHLLFAHYLSLTSAEHNELQTMLNKLRVYVQKKSLTLNTQKFEVMCFNSRPGSFLPPLFFDGTQLPYTDTFKYLGMACDRQINQTIAADAALRPFMASTFRVKQRDWESNSSRAVTLLADYTLISGSSKLTQFLLAWMRVRYGLLPS